MSIILTIDHSPSIDSLGKKDNPDSGYLDFSRDTVAPEGGIHIVGKKPLDSRYYHDDKGEYPGDGTHLLTPDYARRNERRGSNWSEVTDSLLRIADLGQMMQNSQSKRQKELYSTWVKFSETTTAHGVPMVHYSRTRFAQAFWVILSVFFFSFFVFQCSLVVDKYKRNEKIVNVELEFESAPFPAITVCNLNPFKNYLARSVAEISETLDKFHQAVVFSNEAKVEEIRRSRRSPPNGRFKYANKLPAYSACDCYGPPNKLECLAKDNMPYSFHVGCCICDYDRNSGQAWPCHLTHLWKASVCPECNDSGYCNLPNTTGNDPFNCYCQMERGYCIVRPEERIKRIWEVKGNFDRNSLLYNDFQQNHRENSEYGDTTDQVAITTQAKEQLILQMSSLEEQRRAGLSYGKMELIKMCSFNSLPCNIDKDFTTYIDPSFGNCFTFNANKTRAPLVSSRAGPTYGLRLMLFVNSSDYLPTTEATGVRIAIHGQQECPYPDTFGYSAPTGAISSFGISLRKVNRMVEDDGCHDTRKPLDDSYIYRNYKYEPEGCFRSCYQKNAIRTCGCTDPRFPPPARSRHEKCDTRDEGKRNCLLKEAVKLTKNSTQKCRCQHPCEQDVYSTTYSAAKWPSGSIKLECDQASEDCISYYREHAAMVEIYYEQMSYEVLKESVSYSIVNLVSDFGGQAGLWLGASVLTLFEGIFFILQILGIACKRHHKKGESIEKEEKEKQKAENLSNTEKESPYEKVWGKDKLSPGDAK